MPMSEAEVQKIAADCRADLFKIIVDRTGSSPEEVEEIFDEVIAGLSEDEQVFATLLRRVEFQSLQKTSILQANHVVTQVMWSVTLKLDGEICDIPYEATPKQAVRRALEVIDV